MPKRGRTCAGLGLGKEEVRPPTSPAPAPESGPLDGAEPDCPSKEPHPHPTFRAAVCFRPSAWITGRLLGAESALADGG